MAIAAVPNYLGNDFTSASPAMRFGQYLVIWGNDWVKQNFDIKDWRKITQLNTNDKNHIARIIARQKHLAEQQQVFSSEAESIAPFVTGLGNEHPTENGFAFLSPYGIPYLPGSGVKGVLRQAAVELASGEWGETQGWNDAAIHALFGYEAQTKEEQNTQGALRFWDVIPGIKGDYLAVEIMTPHYSEYYKGNETPHDSGQPSPIFFLAVPEGSNFNFHIECNTQRLAHLASELLQENQWQQLISAALNHAFEWLGFGAKTSVGYGAMTSKALQQEEKARASQESLQAAGIHVGSSTWEKAKLKSVSPNSGDIEIEAIINGETKIAKGKFYSELSAAAKKRFKKKAVYLDVDIEEKGNLITIIAIREST